MTTHRSPQESPLDNTEISHQFLYRKLSRAAIGHINKIERRLASHKIPLSEFSAVSLALYPPQQHLSTEYVLEKYKVPTFHITLRSRFISPSAPPVSNILLRGFIFHATCPVQLDRIHRIRMFKPEDSIALARYIYTREVSPIVGSLLGIVRLTEEDLRQPRVASVNWDPTILFMMQTKTERELDGMGVGILAFSKTVSNLNICRKDIWDALDLAWNLLHCAHPDGGRRTMEDWLKLCKI